MELFIHAHMENIENSKQKWIRNSHKWAEGSKTYKTYANAQV